MVAATSDTLTSSPRLKPGDSWLAPFSLLTGRAARLWERRVGWSHKRGGCHGPQLPDRSPYTSLARYPSPPLRVGRAPRQQSAQVLRAGLLCTTAYLWFLLGCCLIVPQRARLVKLTRLTCG